MGRPKRVMRAVELEGGCWVQLTHRLQRGGYYHARYGQESILFHRLVWQHVHGPIPAGLEVDHMCQSRACFNPAHMQLLGRVAHAVKTGQDKSKEPAGRAWLAEHGGVPQGVVLAAAVGVCVSTACGWLRKWRKEGLLSSKRAIRRSRAELRRSEDE